MDGLIKFFIKNSLLVNFISIFVVVAGIIAFFSVKKETRPLVNIGSVVISTPYKGASPLDIEKLISIPIEDELSGIDGIKKIQSTSYVGLSRVYVEIDPDVKDEEKVTNDIYRAIDGITDLPKDAEEPNIFEIKTSNFPIFYILLYSDNGIKDLYEAGDLIEHKLIGAKGVSEVEFYGKMDPVFDVIVDPVFLEKYNLSFNDLIGIISSYNNSGPAGSIVSTVEDTQIRLDQELNSTQKISDLIVRINEYGKDIKIRDVATVVQDYEFNRVVNRFEGKNAIGISIKKSNEADTIKTAASIKQTLNEIDKLLPKTVKYKIIFDDSTYVKDTLKFTSQNALVGFIMVLLILFIGLNNFKMSLVTSLGLPFSFFGAILMIYLLGYSLNMMTLIGVILVVGMLVDDAIVVSENIYFNYEKGLPIEDACVIGVKQVFFPVLGAVSTTVLSFLPLIFMKGIMGKFMSVIPVAVISALIFSLFECFIVLPNHIYDIEKKYKNKSKSKKFKVSFFISKIEAFYTKFIKFVIDHSWKVSLISILFVIIVAVLTFNIIKIELFSSKGITDFSILIKGKDNIPIENTIRASEKVEEIIKKFIPLEVDSYSSTIGQAQRQHGAFLNIGTNYAKIVAYFPSLKERSIDEAVTIKKLREEISLLKIDGFEVFFDVQRGGPPTGSPVDLYIKSENFEKAEAVSQNIRNYMETIPGLVDINDTINRDRFEYKLELDQKIAVELGISAKDLQYVAMNAFEGLEVTSVRTGKYDTNIRVVYPKNYRDDINKLLNLKIKTKLNTYVPIKKILNVVKAPSPAEINRDTKERFISLTADIGDNKLSSKKANKMIRDRIPEFTENYDGVTVEFGGEEEETNEFIKDLIKLLILAFMSIFMVISLIFNSLIYPFFVVLSIPFGLAGAMIALISHNVNFSVAVMVALVGLIGVVVNDAILLIKTIVETNKSNINISFKEAVIYGSIRRLRPILLTSITTLAGLFPAAYEMFGRNEFMKQMSLVMGWGLFFSTIMTLIAIPALLVCAKSFSLALKNIFLKKL